MSNIKSKMRDQTVSSKAHVPINKVQVCHEGEANIISGSAMQSHLGHGDCLLPSCDFANVFLARGSCSNSDNDLEGFCDLENPRDDARDDTPACSGGAY